ncbi:MAG TPA: ATP-binding domain-containing protein [Bryobacteraceae bacterium]|nr:ATP-binding domain-containing protein [Bryobacteraceae bacterium]
MEPGRRARLYANDKVIQTKNDYGRGVMNGTVGFVRESWADGSLAVDFEGSPVEFEADSPDVGNVQLAYITSIHKAQGAEFPCVIAIVHRSHTFMHDRNLLYTAVTRAKESAVILGDRASIHNCARSAHVDKRKTTLSFLLNETAAEGRR